MPVAVMASEDQLFLKHHGFDFKAINAAIEESRAGKRHRGGSTISQQTAKNVFLWPAHSWVRKGLEAYFTGLIELIWGKHRIMEVYLNSIEMGDGIYGTSATLPNPLKFSSQNPSSYMLKRQTAIMKQMRHIDVFPQK